MTKLNVAQALQDEIAMALAAAKGIPFQEAITFAEPVVRHLQQQYGGDELYIPQPYQVRDVRDVLAAKDRGMTVKEICREFRISRSTYFRTLSQVA
jgi:Mor family transcriptional regulator